MKRSWWLLWLVSAAGAAPASLCPNGSFEAALADGLPPHWTKVEETTENLTCRLQAGKVGQAVAVTAQGGTNGLASPRLAVDRTQTYLAGAWVKLPEDCSANLKFALGDARRAWTSTGITAVRGTGEWQEIRIQDRLDEWAEVTHLGVEVTFFGEGTALFDEVELLAVPKLAGNPQILRSGNLESGADRPDGWYRPLSADNQPVLFGWLPEAAHSGARGVRVSGGIGGGVWLNQGVDCEADTVYTLTAWVKVTAGTARLRVVQLHNREDVGQVESEALAVGDWRQVRMTFRKTPEWPATHHIAVGIWVPPDAAADVDEFVLDAKPAP
ncbi:MAG: hypothetical protein IT204_11830 [Fimbriimonadaceae bacterium]|nr:hypothetical protein [Fimbriimonadaceae bacterium]